MEKPATWDFDENNALFGALESSEEPAAAEPSGDFLNDYLMYTDLLKIVPHPCLNPRREQWLLKVAAQSRPAPVLTVGDGSGSDDDEDLEDDDEEEDEGETVLQGLKDDMITIRGWRLDQGTLAAMTWSLKVATGLTKLTFWKASLSASDIALLTEAVVASQVKHVAIEWNPVSAEDTESKSGVKDELFTGLLRPEASLESLWLRGNDISAGGATAIAKALRGNKLLVDLNLASNCAGDAGAAAFVDTLFLNRSLRRLGLAGNGISNMAFDGPLNKSVVPEHLLEVLKAQTGVATTEGNAAAGGKKGGKKGKAKAGKVEASGPGDVPQPEQDGESGVWTLDANKVFQEIDLSAQKSETECCLGEAAVRLSHDTTLHWLALSRNGYTEEQKETLLATVHESCPFLKIAL